VSRRNHAPSGHRHSTHSRNSSRNSSRRSAGGSNRRRRRKSLGLAPTSPHALQAQHFAFEGPGHVVCYFAGQGPAVLLVHSVNAAASAAEVRPLFEALAANHTVFAIDLPGYGMSERSDRAYTPRLMTDALHHLAELIRQRGYLPAGTGLDALAVSLSCEFLARAAVERPALWGRLALVSPTGFNGTRSSRAAPGTTRFMPWLHRLVSVRLWSQALFNGLTKPSVVRYFLRRTFGSPAGRDTVDHTLWQQAVHQARAPGARFAPLHFLSGSMFSADIHTVYEAVQQPVWMSHGIRGDFTDYRNARLVAGKPNWRITQLDTGAMPYFEMPSAFMKSLNRFWGTGQADT
jgi:pimeloyl-ACP methyl ester carboxylesterase